MKILILKNQTNFIGFLKISVVVIILEVDSGVYFINQFSNKIHSYEAKKYIC